MNIMTNCFDSKNTNIHPGLFPGPSAGTPMIYQYNTRVESMPRRYLKN
jgi:hypothetical protein